MAGTSCGRGRDTGEYLTGIRGRLRTIWRSFGTAAEQTRNGISGFIPGVEAVDRKPTIRQIYALAAVLCEHAGEEFPETSDGASELIERLRIESGHPAPRLEGTPLRPRRRGPRGRRGSRGGGGHGADRLASMIAKKLVEELR
jgi:hypothetical protein